MYIMLIFVEEERNTIYACTFNKKSQHKTRVRREQGSNNLWLYLDFYFDFGPM